MKGSRPRRRRRAGAASAVVAGRTGRTRRPRGNRPSDPVPESTEDAGSSTETAADRTRAAVQSFLARLQEGDPEDIAEAFAERVDWVIADNPAVPWVRPRRTRADVAGHFREVAEGQEADPAGTSINAVTVDGTEALLSGWLAGTVRATGKTFRSPFTIRLTVENGLIVRYRVVEDALTIAAACTPDARPPRRTADG
ncbi:nuclear transport factor 2 family protein [Streptomyces jumonjinensis]|uniref:nuclear transport factor 2 family protein n=1 Tax=Streptomyces jumonjinensis TaxID=1945 RepID=UPI0037B52315